MIITGDDDVGVGGGGGSSEAGDDLLHEMVITGDLQLEDEDEDENDEELVDDVECLLEEQVVVEDGVQYEIELE